MALAFLLAFAVIAAVYLPCYFRWGFGRGNVAAALVIAAGVIASGIGGRAAPGVGVLAAGEAAARGVPPGRIPQGVAALVDRVGLGAGALIVLALAAGLLLGSARIAVRSYERREF
jgi:hypothetical protein